VRNQTNGKKLKIDDKNFFFGLDGKKLNENIFLDEKSERKMNESELAVKKLFS
jgi:hypothetical protein